MIPEPRDYMTGILKTPQGTMEFIVNNISYSMDYDSLNMKFSMDGIMTHTPIFPEVKIIKPLDKEEDTQYELE
jgi:hypothetical protein